jgi:putative ABC transport system permease protein
MAMDAIEGVRRELRHSVRTMMRRPGFSLVAVVTLALGVGANAAVFSVMHAVLLRRLPFANQDEIVVAWKEGRRSENPLVELSLAEFRDWESQNRSFESLAAMPTTVFGYSYAFMSDGKALQLESAKVTGRFFSVLGARAAFGRTIGPDDDRPHGRQIVVLSDRVWREQLNADPTVIGRAIELNRMAHTVVGVMPPAFSFPEGVDLWVPLTPSMSDRAIASRGIVFLQAIGRLRPGVTLGEAEAELNTIIGRLAKEYPETRADDQRAALTPIAEYVFGNSQLSFRLLFAATALLLVIAAANVANLMLAQGVSRRKEYAVRRALGAGWWRLFGQLAGESTVLVGAGGIVGLVLAYGLIGAMVRIAPADIPRIEDAGLNMTVVTFSMGVMGLVALGFAAVSMLTATARADLCGDLREGSRTPSGDARRGMRGALVVAEVTVMVVLLGGTLVILRSFVNLNRVKIGFDARNVMTVQLRLTGAVYREAAARRAFLEQLIDRLEAHPQVSAAGAVLMRPLDGAVGWDLRFTAEGQTDETARQNPVANYEVVSPHYFLALGIPVRQGRVFGREDASSAPLVVIVSEGLADKLFGSEADAVGKRVKLGAPSSAEPWRTIVGVVGDVRYRELGSDRKDLYVPLTQSGVTTNHLVVRTTSSPANALPLMRQEVARLDSYVPIAGAATLEELVSRSMARPRYNTILLNCLSTLACLLALVGIYGMMSYSVARRSAEFGVRIALGAQRQDIVRLVTRQAMLWTGIGLGIGLPGTLLARRAMRDLLFGVSVHDVPSLVVVVVLVAAIALVACYVPVRRAASVDPIVALREE